MNEKSGNIFQWSYWERQSFFNKIDIAVIGSGIVGLNAALEMKKKFPDQKIVVLERGFLPYGASTRNAGFACFGSLSELIDDAARWDEKTLYQITQKRIRGIQKIKQLCGATAIGLQNLGGYELFFENNRAQYDKCMDQMHRFNAMVYDICGEKDCFTEQTKAIRKFGFAQTSHLLFNRLEAQLDTGKLMRILLQKVAKKGIPVYTGINIDKIQDEQEGVRLHLNEAASFFTKKAVVCTNAFTKMLLPHLEIIPARAQVLITKPIEKLKVKGTFHFDEGYYYFRNIDNRILFGGARNMAFQEEATEAFGVTDRIQGQLERLLKEIILPNVPIEIDMRWSGIMAFGTQKVPIVEMVSKNVLVAARMNGMGVAIGGIIAEEAANLVEDAWQ